MFEERPHPVLSDEALVRESEGLQPGQSWGVLVFSTDKLQHDVCQVLVAQQAQALQVRAVLYQLYHHSWGAGGNQ